MNSVRIRVFGVIREIVGSNEVEMNISGPVPARDLLDLLAKEHPRILEWQPYLRVAVNHEYLPGGATVSPGDEVALIPPVSGG